MFDSLYLCAHLYTHGWKFRSLAPSFSVFPWPGAGKSEVEGDVTV